MLGGATGHCIEHTFYTCIILNRYWCIRKTFWITLRYGLQSYRPALVGMGGPQMANVWLEANKLSATQEPKAKFRCFWTTVSLSHICIAHFSLFWLFLKGLEDFRVFCYISGPCCECDLRRNYIYLIMRVVYSVRLVFLSCILCQDNKKMTVDLSDIQIIAHSVWAVVCLHWSNIPLLCQLPCM